MGTRLLCEGNAAKPPVEFALKTNDYKRLAVVYEFRSRT